MIRKLQEPDIDQVADVWLDTNLKAHDFIPAQYWKDNFESVKKMLLQSEVYVYENETTHNIDGFLGLSANYIAGIFVCVEYQSNGIGKQLLDYVKTIKPELSLYVYKKNTRAVKFYQREDFRISAENIDEDTNEAEYEMLWQKQSELFIGE